MLEMQSSEDLELMFAGATGRENGAAPDPR
jgi:hypothetical protein